MRITRGDNIAFLLLPGITFLGIILTFIIGHVRPFFVSQKVEIHNVSDRTVISFQFTCDEKNFQSELKAKSTAVVEMKRCKGDLTFTADGIDAGRCFTLQEYFDSVQVRYSGNIIENKDCEFY